MSAFRIPAQATLEGIIVLAKARGSAAIVADCPAHLQQHVAHLLRAVETPAISKEPTP